ncbi:MAG: lactonase family protein [Mangrovibacterium sp.]
MRVKIYSFFSLVALAMLVACQSPKNKLALYIGTYSVEGSEGIYRYSFDPKNGELTPESVTETQENPSYISISPNKKYLYAVSEVNNYNHQDSGSVTAYKIEPDGSLTRLNQVATLGNHPCHVTVSPDGKTLAASNYTSGSISIFKVNDDGSLAVMPQLVQHVGFGPDTARQQGPHAHSSLFTADGKTLVAADLGIDKLLLTTWSADSGKFISAPQPFIPVSPGAGPRHFGFSPDGRFMYAMMEMSSTVCVVEKMDTAWTVIQETSSLPDGYSGVKAGADIHLGPDGRFVYCSNRGHNSIAVFSRDAGSGKLALIQNQPVQGDWPRNFALSPDGKFLLAANQRSNNITVFSVDEESGKLAFTGKNYPLPSPACLKFLEN